MAPPEEHGDTATRILEAARRALVERGYDNLSMSAVAAEFDGSQSLIHYHFDSREGLLAAVIAQERERYAEFFESFPEDPAERLDRLTEVLIRDLAEWAEESGMATRIVELYAAATDAEPIRTELRELNALFRKEYERTIADGIEAGVFEPVDPGEVARLLVAGMDSALDRYMLGEPEEIPRIADALEAYVLGEVRR